MYKITLFAWDWESNPCQLANAAHVLLYVSSFSGHMDFSSCRWTTNQKLDTVVLVVLSLEESLDQVYRSRMEILEIHT